MKNKIKYLPIGLLTLTTAVSGAVLSGLPASAETKTATVNVATACGFTGTATFSTTIGSDAGVTVNTEGASSGKSSFTVSCNNPNGFYITAVGFSPDANNASGVEGNTALYSTVGTIPTGTSGSGSYWSMKVTSVSGTGSSIATTDGVNYANYASVPSSDTKVINYAATSSTDAVSGTIRTDYQVHTTSTQTSGTYKGAVKYKIVEN